MQYNLNVYYSSHLATILSIKGFSITGFEIAAVTSGSVSISDGLIDSAKRSLNWRPADTTINNDNSISICINPSDDIFSGYRTINLIHFSYIFNNFKGPGGNQLKYLGGSVYLTDNNDQLINIKDTILDEVVYNLDPLNNIIKLPLNYENKSFIPIECEFICSGNEQVYHYDSEVYQMNSYYNPIENSFRDSKSVKHEINYHKITNDPIRNYNTMRLASGGVTK